MGRKTKKDKDYREFDRKILFYMKRGKTTKEISERFKKKGIVPNGTATIDLRIKSMKEEHKAKNLFQLGHILTKRKIIK